MAHSGGAGVPAGGEEGDGSFAAALSRGQTAGAVFCKRCGAMLTLPDSGDARCDVCGAHVPLSGKSVAQRAGRQTVIRV